MTAALSIMSPCTVAFFSWRLTSTAETPATPSTAVVTAWAQWSQVMPVTLNSMVFDMGMTCDHCVHTVTTAVEGVRSEEHTSELQSLTNIACRLLLEKNRKAT